MEAPVLLKPFCPQYGQTLIKVGAFVEGLKVGETVFGILDTGDGIIKVPQGPYGPMGPYGPCGLLIIPSPV